MKKFLLLLAFFTATQSHAQRVGINKSDPNAGTASAKLKTAIASKAAADKVLAATVDNVKLIVNKASFSELYVFNQNTITLTGNGSAFSLNGGLAKPWLTLTDNGTSYTFKGITYKADKVGNEVIRTCTYADLLEKGFAATINFKNRDKPRFPVGKEWSADFTVVFNFSDGTTVSVPLQDINLSKTGTWKSTSDLTVSKTIAGNAFPDPANPIALPVIK